MSPEENKHLLLRYLDEVWNQRNPEAAAEFLAPDFKRYTSAVAPPLDADGQLQRLRGFRAAFPDAQVQVGDVVGEDDLVVFRSTMTGTHDGELLGIAPTGRKVEVALLDMIRIRDGRFIEHWGGPDLFDLTRQLQG